MPFHTAGEDVTRYIYLNCHPGSVYVMYVCMCVGYECVSSILYVVMHDYISSLKSLELGTHTHTYIHYIYTTWVTA